MNGLSIPQCAKEKKEEIRRFERGRLEFPRHRRREGGKIRIRLLAAFGTSEWGKEANLQIREIRHPIEKSRYQKQAERGQRIPQ